ncbi:MAG: acyl-CoA thioesterase [Rhizobiales bacterium]|nr:acyl-CoA thioesterase [Hyphomicrobiales bacterium]
MPAEPPPVGPWRHVQTIGWAECDVAQIVYTGTMPRLAITAIDAWWTAVTGADFYRLNLEYGIGTPFVHMSFDFRSPVTPRHPLECIVGVARIGNSSVTYDVTGRQAQAPCFQARLVSAFVEAGTFTKIAIPPRLRERIAATCAAPSPITGRLD